MMRGVPIKAIAELMGHSSILVTSRYAHLAPRHLAQAVELLADPEISEGENRNAIRSAFSASGAPANGNSKSG
jgi:hypothetical protein